MNRKESGIKKRKPVVVFICTHNACRSQIAEAFGRVMAGDVFTSYSAGTHSKDAINPDVVRLEDPTGKDDAAYIDVMEQIRRYIARLKEKIEQEDEV